MVVVIILSEAANTPCPRYLYPIHLFPTRWIGIGALWSMSPCQLSLLSHEGKLLSVASFGVSLAGGELEPKIGG
jgi:hypothetical protein